MIDSTHSNGTNGLATALRDRSSCTMPTQPNRSLPVRPAPHTPCRSLLSKTMNKKPDTEHVEKEILINNSQNTIPMSTSSVTSMELSSVIIDSHQSLSSSSSSSSSSLSSLSSLSSSSLLKAANHNVIRINVPNWQNEIRLPIINVEVTKTKTSNDKNNDKCGGVQKHGGMKRKVNTDVTHNGNIGLNNYSKNVNCNFIDITKSPERYINYSANIESSKSDCAENFSITLQDNDEDDKAINAASKKRRKKKEKRSSFNNVSSLKIVPPLRLKKIQCLQENTAADCLNNHWSYVPESIDVNDTKEPIADIGFRYYQPNSSPINLSVEDTISPASDAKPNEYRIVSGQTPPHTNDTHNQSLISVNYSDKKLQNHQETLQMKLCELKRKTFELGREMIKTAFTSPNNSIQETIDSYKKQIERLNNLIEKLPDPQLTNTITIQIPESPLPNTIVSSSSSLNSTDALISSYCDSSQSPGPPQLSPKISIDLRNIQNPNALRNSPPLLSKINLSNDDKCHWIESDFSKESPKNDCEKSCSIGVTTTSECLIDEEIEIDNKPEILDLAINEVVEPNTNSTQNHSVNKVEVEKKIHGISGKTTSPFTNPDEIINNIATKNIIDKFPDQNNRITSPKISSSCDPLKNSRANKSTVSDNKRGATERIEDNFLIGNQFPSLRSWLNNSFSTSNIKSLTTKLLDVKSPERIIIPNNELTTTKHSINEHFNQTKNLNIPAINPRNNNIPEPNTNVNESHWNNTQWSDQAHRHGHLSGNSNAINISVGSNQFPPTASLAGTYTGDYQMDSCRPYNYSHTTIASATNPASTASLWNNAILEYPLVRPNIISKAPSSMKLNANVSEQHVAPTSANTTVPLSPQNVVQSTNYHSQDIAKTMSINNSTNTKLPHANFPKQNDYSSSSSFQPLLFPASSNTAENQRLHSLLSQENFYRYYHPQAYLLRQTQQQHQQQAVRYVEGFSDTTNRLPIHDRSLAQMNYRPPWRGPMQPPSPFVPTNSYGIRHSWPLDPCNLLSTLSPATLQHYITPFNMGMPINTRCPKERISQTRNCDTPHLGKVEYSPNTSRNLKCSNCSRPDPTFKCLGCEKTFYCDESCQAKHWNRHVISCPKKMPKLKKVVL